MPALHVIRMVANDGDLQQRVAACAADKGVEGPEGWAVQNRWKVATYDQIAEVYEYAESTKTINVNQNTGQRTDSVTDVMIAAAVDAIILASAPPA